MQIRNHILYETDKDLNDRNKFVADLPEKLKQRVSIYMYEEVYENIKIYKDKSVDFIVWICPKLINIMYKADDMLYIEGDRVKSVYSIVKG